MKFRSLIAAALALLVGASAQASISFVVNADQLLSSSSIVIPDGSAVFIVAATNGTFVTPTPGDYTVGSSWGNVTNTDLIIYAVGSRTESGEQGVVDSTPTLTLGNGWATGDELALYWFPTITYSAGGTVLTGGAGYGTFNSSSTGDDASDWVTPANSTSGYNLLYLTPGGALLGPGNDVGTFGTVTSVPEPSTFALLGGVLALGAILRRRLASTA
jgi:hypothetical protein